MRYVIFDIITLNSVFFFFSVRLHLSSDLPHFTCSTVNIGDFKLDTRIPNNSFLRSLSTFPSYTLNSQCISQSPHKLYKTDPYSVYKYRMAYIL